MKLKALIIALVIFAVIAAAFFIAYDKINKSLYPLEFTEFIDKYCDEYDVPRSLAYAVIRTESGFDPSAVSRVGAIGLMQLMPDTFSWLSRLMEIEERPELISDPETNIRYGIYYLHHLYIRFGSASWDTVLAGYNAGHGRVTQWLADAQYSDDGVTLKNIPYEETRSYIKKVNSARDKYITIYSMEA